MKIARKTFAILLSLLLLLSTVPLAVVGAEDAGPTWTWDEATETVTFTGVGAIPDAPEPAELMETVNPIPEFVRMKHLVIGEGITHIGSYAFYFCPNLEDVTLPSTLASIGYGAFLGCIVLTDPVFPSSLRDIGGMAFANCFSLDKVVLPEGLTRLGYGAFIESMASEFTLPSTLTEVYEGDTVMTDLSETLLSFAISKIDNRTDNLSVSLFYGFPNAEARDEFCRFYRIYYRYYAKIFVGASEEEIYSEMIGAINAEYGTDIAPDDMDALESFISSRMVYEPSVTLPGYLIVTCKTGSAQHTVCEEKGIRHILAETGEECLPDNPSGVYGDITWRVDVPERLLVFGGTGPIVGDQNGSDFPWRKYAAYFDGVRFEAGSAVTALGSDTTMSPLANCNVESLVLPETLTLLSANTLAYLRLTLKDLTVAPGNLGNATTDAIYGNVNIRTLAIPDSVTKLEPNAVTGLGMLESVSYGKNVQTADVAVSYCGMLNGIVVDGENPYLKSVDGCVYTKDGTKLVNYVHAGRTSFTLGEEVASLADRVFDDDGKLQDLYVLNDRLSFEDAYLDEQIILHGHEGSAAEAYARDRHLRFVIIERQAVTAVEIVSAPETVMQGEKINKTQIRLLVTFADGATAERAEGFTMGDYSTEQLGEITVPVTYAGITVNLTLTVVPYAEPAVSIGHPIEIYKEAASAYKDMLFYFTFTPEEDGDYMIMTRSTSDYGGGVYMVDENGVRLGDDCYYSESSVSLTGGQTYRFVWTRWSPYVGFGETLYVSVAPYHVHNYGSEPAYYDPAPTCTTEGVAWYACSVCGRVYSSSVGRLEHELDENGVCIHCGECFLYTVEYRDALDIPLVKGTNYNPLIISFVAPETGVANFLISEGGNRWNEPSFYADAGMSERLSFEGELLYGADENDEEYATWLGTVRNLTPGQTYYMVLNYGTCYEPDVTLHIEYLDHHHDFTSELLREPSCSAPGLNLRACRYCDFTYREYVNKTPHTMDPATRVVTYEPDCGQGYWGVARGTCSVCGQPCEESVRPAHADADGDNICDKCGKRLSDESLTVGVPAENDFDGMNTTFETEKRYRYAFVAPADGLYLFNVTASVAERDPQFDGTGWASVYFYKADGYDSDYGFGLWVNSDVRHTFNMQAGEIRYIEIVTEYLSDFAYTVEVQAHTEHSGYHSNGWAPSCYQDGMQPYWYCTTCYKFFSDEYITEVAYEDLLIPAAHTLTYHPATATCTADGTREYWSCSVCGGLFADEAASVTLTDADLPAAALGHDMGEWFEKTPATCTENGVSRRECSRCDYFEEEPIEKLGHDMGAWFEKAPATCTENGVSRRECSRCDYYEEEPIGMLGHDMGAWTVSVPATCTNRGTERRDCSRCDYYETRDGAPATGHAYGSWTRVDDNNHRRVCANDPNHVETAPHNWDGGRVTKTPTCTVRGETTFTCRDCGATKVTYQNTVQHKDDDHNGYCDYGCGTAFTQPEPPHEDEGDKCPYCGETHTGFFGRIVAFFHRIAYFFRNLFR